MNKLLSPSDVGKIVNRDRKTVVDWIRKYQLPAAVLPSGQYLIRQDEFEVWLKKRNQATGCRLLPWRHGALD
jgi:predicted site-specific integrase-resolvase